MGELVTLIDKGTQLYPITAVEAVIDPSTGENIQNTLNTLNTKYTTVSEIIERDIDANTVTSLTSLPIDKTLIVANLSTASSISLSSELSVGNVLTIICVPTADFEQPLPNTGNFSSLDGDSLSITNGQLFEISILCYAVGKYSISCKISG